MNFFEHQDKARQKTLLLVCYFILAVLAIASSVSLVIYLFANYVSAWQLPLTRWMMSEANLYIIGTTLLIILIGSARKLYQLRRGGLALASLVGALEIDHTTAASDEKQLLNVTEEMSIASGIPMPRVFVMRHERAINAFVAGFRPTETVMVVTQGLLDNLDREELQGVIGHEFSHIFNADMKLNLRLIALLSGILAIGKIGELLIFSNTRRSFTAPSRVRYSSSSRNSKEGGGLILLGVALVIIGYVGLFFGRLIKAAISRQRELLADASAVQFTRNPAGIANALIKIQLGPGSHLISTHAEDMSHMCFGETLHFNFSGLLATHPPLEQRINAIGPQWAARAKVRAKKNRVHAKPHISSANAHFPPEHANAFAGNGANGPPVPHTDSSAKAATAATAGVAALSELVGQPAERHMGYARSLLDSIPEALRFDFRNPPHAKNIILGLVASFCRDGAESFLATLDTEQAQTIRRYKTQLAPLGSRLRLPIIDLTLPALKSLNDDDRQHFLNQLEAAIRADKSITPFEFTLSRILTHHLEKDAEKNRRIRFRSYRKLGNDIQLVLSLLIHASGRRGEQAESAFSQIASRFDASMTLLPASECTLHRLDQALVNLCDLTPLLKAPIVNACADIVMADGQVQVTEAELLRAICTLIDCPMPPLFTE